MIRAFLAVELSQDVRSRVALAQQSLKASLAPELPKAVRLSWVQPASIHLTIKFLGDMDEQLVKPLREALEEIFTDQRSILIPLERLGAFPTFQSPRVIWVGPSERWGQDSDAKHLAVLHQSVETCCDALGFAPESRSLSPHLTLARIKAGWREFGQSLAKSAVPDQPLSLGLLTVDSVVLMESELNPTGSVYTKLWEVRLKPS